MLGLLQASVLAGCVLLSSLTHYLHWASAELPSPKALHQLLFEGAVVREVLLMSCDVEKDSGALKRPGDFRVLRVSDFKVLQ